MLGFMDRRDIVVIGASAGGIDALLSLLAALPGLTRVGPPKFSISRSPIE
jgi:chemotaxis response regulator CheB